jgi:hypothetical protein|tara:strand:+ start:711 stop:2144 length:1434 start_codon:yes stop_codon:yes gene_type:complete
MIPVRRNIDTDDLIFWLDPSNPLSYIGNEASVSYTGNGKNQFAGTLDFTNTGLGVTSRVWNDTAAGIDNATVANEPLVLDPNGGTETTAFIETANTGTKFLNTRIEIVPPAPQDSSIRDQITYSLYVKQGPGSRNIRISHSNAPPNSTIIFDFSTNTITSAVNVDDSGFEDAGGGWYRIWYTTIMDTTTTLNNTQARTYIYILGPGDAITYTGDGTSGVYIWGPQWEQGVLSNYTERPSAANFEYFQNNKFVRISTDTTLANPTPYTTSFEGTNFRFDGVNRGFYGGADIRTPFRPNPDNASLQDHSAFAWVKLDKTGNPDQGLGWSPNLKVYTVLGNIGGRSNSGVFGIEENGTSLIYKLRCIKSIGGVTSPVLQSAAIADLDNSWHLISFSFNFTLRTAYFYLDGALISSEQIFDPIASINGSTGSGTIGYFPISGQPTPSGQFKGSMNSVGLYNKELSADDHEGLYNATKYRFT